MARPPSRTSKVSPRGRGGPVVAVPKPGTSVQWNVFKSPSMERINGLSGNRKSPKFARADLKSGKYQVFRNFGGTYHVEMQLIGWRTLIMDQYAVSSLVTSLATQVTQLAGELVRDSALRDSTFQDQTGETRRSMLKDPVMILNGDDVIAEMGPTTFYAPFLEFGWVKGGTPYAYPFMIPALDKHTVDFINGHIDVMGIVAGERPYVLRPPMGRDKRITSTMSRARNFLYTYEKALGDVAVLTGSAFIGPVRAAMLMMAKQLGDLSASMQGTVGARISTRITGRVTGRGLGYVNTIVASRTYSGSPGGSSGVGSRVYNRVAGRVTAPLARGGI